MSSERILVSNLKRLMGEGELSTQTALSIPSGVSQPHIGYILRGEKCPTLDIVDKLARAFGLKAWQMLVDVPQEKGTSTADMLALVACFVASSASGRETILRVAEAQAHYKTDR